MSESLWLFRWEEGLQEDYSAQQLCPEQVEGGETGFSIQALESMDCPGARETRLPLKEVLVGGKTRAV